MDYLNISTISPVKNEDEANPLEFLAGQLFSYTIIPLSIFIGIPLNILSLIIIFRGSLWKTTIFRYLAAVSGGDLLVLIGYAFRGFAIVQIKNITSDLYKLLYCQFSAFFYISFIQFSALNLVAVTFDRYLCVAHPTKAKIWSSLRTCNRVIIGLIVYTLGVNMFIPFAQDHAERISPSRIECMPKNRVGKFMYDYFLTYTAFVYSYFPSITLAILNVLIVISLKKHSKSVKLAKENSKDEKMKAVTRRLTILNLFISTSFIGLTFPISCFIIYARTFSKNFASNPIERTIYETTFIINSLNHVINFFVYCLCGQTFRVELFNLCGCFQKKKEKSVTRTSYISE